MIEPFMEVPAYETDRSLYSDWGDPREFTIGDMGTGECAGEVISVTQFDLADAERLVFEAQLRIRRRKLRAGGCAGVSRDASGGVIARQDAIHSMCRTIRTPS